MAIRLSIGRTELELERTNDDTRHARVTALKDVAAILDVFQAHGHHQVDTARVYARGVPGQARRGLAVDTKLDPTVVRAPRFAACPQVGLLVVWLYFLTRNTVSPPGIPAISHSPEDLRKHLQDSLMALKTNKINLFYLHGPDRRTPYEVTLKAVDELYKEGLFAQFGISNYMSHTATGYWNDATFDALESGEAVGDKHGLTLAEIALRWVSHPQAHEARAWGLGVDRGVEPEAYRAAEDVVKALDKAWACLKGKATPYFH
ncbi:hypothetical protein GLOTRDRAFT_125189 [Gloeophyllum trabeum ATCC 11539]|uniref:NADP-dependent oxidoreductase domain-containing protein n=1 Tax=Gloeophyllum trabeum (strain ATCC 11539 / FP-39264 / Madison 617) TaxID=670483 RepID=S7QJQ7_GLOTA|nr:uncharacterized protein GLOTRDRAFT_125189 [Gloeophyllum trabeum ATCC 11539]EPQ59936.1 hypothetical protein GLOTRDRAFT_125189 [Gloeophyllum trabeum ATCC 11539]